MTVDDCILKLSSYHIPRQNGIAKTTEIIETTSRSLEHRRAVLGDDYRSFTRFRYNFEPDVFRHEKFSENWEVKKLRSKLFAKLNKSTISGT